ISVRQEEILKILEPHLSDDKKIRIFLNKKNLCLSYEGFNLLKDKFKFDTFAFETPLTIKEISRICELNTDIFYIPKGARDKIYVTDTVIKALLTVSQGDKTILF